MHPLVKQVLEKMVATKSVPSTLLFSGPAGVGKRTCALAFAELLMGPSSGIKLRAGTHPDLHRLIPAGKSATHPIEAIRALIAEAALPPYEALLKVFIIEGAHQMLPSSSNALLKVLEEPFDHSHFILVTSEEDALLPTLRSRCRKIPFFLLSQEEIEKVVQEKWEKKPQEARKIAFLSHGSLGKAELLLHPKSLAWKEPLMTLLSLYPPRDYPQMRQLLTQLDPSDEEDSLPAEMLLEEAGMWWRDLHLLKAGGALEHLYHLDHLDALKLALQLPLPPLEKVMELLSTARLSLQRHVRLSTALEHILLNIY